MVVLLVGSTGAGKTTYGQKLAKTLPGFMYSIDEWMKSLYWPDMPPAPDMQWFVENQAWYVERIARCEAMILANAQAWAKLGQNCILDLGFSTAEHRRKFIHAFLDEGREVETHFLNVSADQRWQRVQKRNQERGETYVMQVDRGMFDYMESIFELPTAAEGAKVVNVKSS